MKPHSKRIGLFGLFGAGNIGNDGSLDAMLRFVREAHPGAELTCICADPTAIEKQFRVPAISLGGNRENKGRAWLVGGASPISKLRGGLSALRRVRGVDVLIVPGTGILDDFGARFWGMPAALFAWCLSARLWGAKVAFVSVGAGPIDHPISRWLIKWAARMAHYRSYRDAISKEFMRSIGVDTGGDAVYPDIAFRLPTPVVPRSKPGLPQSLSVGVGVMAYYGWSADAVRGAEIYQVYLSKITLFVVWLLDHGHNVRIITGETTDARAVRDVLQGLASSRPCYPRERVVAEPAQSLHDLMRQIADTQVVVATRFHNVVCALKLNRPTISIGYAKKNDVLMAEMGLGEFCQNIDRFNVDTIIAQFSDLMSQHARYEQYIAQANLVFSNRIAAQDKFLTTNIL